MKYMKELKFKIQSDSELKIIHSLTVIVDADKDLNHK